jgi:hypothetical protein
MASSACTLTSPLHPLFIVLTLSFDAPNYASPESGPYLYYVRKPIPAVTYNAISQDSTRAKRIRTFNDFANEAVNGMLPQWLFITPNIVRLLRPSSPTLCIDMRID